MSSVQKGQYSSVPTDNGKSNDVLPDVTFKQDHAHENEEKCTIIPMRVVLVILGCFGFITFYAMRVNLSVAMVAMVGKPRRVANGTNETLQTCPELINSRNATKVEETKIIMGEFDWDSQIQGQILGSFFYGYLFTQIPGGILAEKCSAKWVTGFGILVTAIFTLLTPLAARWSIWTLMAARVIEGLASGVVPPAMTVMISQWSPKNERSRITTAICVGIMVGTVITNPITGILCESPIFGGWPSAFYIFGSLGCVWFLLWAVLVYESPETHPFITKKELTFIQANIEKRAKINVKIPWKSIWTSLPVWAVVIGHFGHNWAFYTLLIMAPTYLSNVLHFDLKNNGILSGLPWLTMTLCSILASLTADTIRASGRLEITTIRKLMTSIAIFLPGVCVLSIAFIGCHPIIIVAVLCLSFGFNGFIFSGVLVNHVDMSPQFAGTLFGITNTAATLPGFLAPTLIGVILKSGQTLNNWGIIFMMTSAIYFIVGIFYIIFASADLQPWNNINEDRHSKELPKSAVSFKSPSSYSVKYINHQNDERSDILAEEPLNR
nr:putative inorganic phosphate cotransporter isoform X1 [Parasteatoda tepidariorum]XP_042911232.1 putative inorganic phosphate cotransporter isoform X2 [Parasteatoda tepidariorum]